LAEVSVAVWSAPIQWKKADVPAFEESPRMRQDPGMQAIVCASFDRANAQRLHGQFISGQELHGEWELRLVQADGESFSGATVVDEEGRFSVHDPALELLSSFAAVQILLVRGEREARATHQGIGSHAGRSLRSSRLRRSV
jgi:hypothetical protein